jgi:hypothetical protein
MGADGQSSPSSLDSYVAVYVAFERGEIAEAVLLTELVGYSLGSIFEHILTAEDVSSAQKKVPRSSHITQGLQQTHINGAEIGPSAAGHERTTHAAYATHAAHHRHARPPSALAEIAKTYGIDKNVGTPRGTKGLFTRGLAGCIHAVTYENERFLLTPACFDPAEPVEQGIVQGRIS